MKLPIRLLVVLLTLATSLAHGQLYKLPLLESLPSSQYVIFLDFDGQNVRTQYWNGGFRIEAQPSNATEQDIFLTWQIVSEDYSPFNINVTTDSTVFHRSERGKRMRCIFTPTGAWSNFFSPGGVAIRGSFTVLNDDVPCWAFNAVGRQAGEIASHEVGHTLGLAHDGRQVPGQPLEQIYRGHNQWGSIMAGSFATSMFTQWSKGEYNYATNTEDDIAVIGGAFNGFGFRTDDVGNTFATSKDLVLDAHGTIGNVNKGVISQRDDIDMYRFVTTGGTVVINAEGLPGVLLTILDTMKLSNLDINMKLMDDQGNVLANSDNPGKLSASIGTTLPGGVYYISIDGIGKLDPAIDGYSDYGSLGQYFLSGTIPVGANQAPIVKILPAQHFSFQGTMFNPDAYAYDVDGGISRIDFYNYDTLLHRGHGGDWQQVIWTFNKPGMYKLTARAYDDMGLMSESAPVYMEYVLPEAKIITPIVGSTYQEGSTITITATARTHSRYSINAVQFYDGTNLLFQDNSAPYSYDWTNAPAGVHKLYAKAISTADGWSEATTITVLPLAPTSFTHSTENACEGSTNVVFSFSDVVPGYSYEWEYSGTGFTITSGDGTSSITGAFDIGATSGTLSVRSVSNGVKSSSLSVTITLLQLPATPSSIIGGNSVAAGSTENTYNVIAEDDITYEWSYSGDGAILAANGANVEIDFATTASSGILSVVAQNTCGDSPASTLEINVTPLPPVTPSIFTTSTSEICSGSTAVAYAVPAVTGETYLWEYSGTGLIIVDGDGTNSITADFGSMATSGTLSVKAERNGQTSSALTMQITVENIPSSPGSISGNTSPNAGTSENLYSVTPANNTSYEWSYDRVDASLIENGASASLDFLITAQPGTLSVTAENMCGSSAASTLFIDVTPVAPESPTAFTTSTESLCAGSTGIIYAVAQASGVSYTWEYSGNGLTITEGDGTNSIVADFGSGATSGTLSIKAVRSGLSSAALTMLIEVNTTPTSLGSISGNSSPQAGSSGNIYSVSSENNVAYLWSYSGNDAVLTSDGGEATLDFPIDALPGILTVSAINSCGSSPAATLPIEVEPVAPEPPDSFTNSISTLCAGSTNVIYSVPAVNGVSYLWTYTGTGLIINSGDDTNSILVEFSPEASSGTLSVQTVRNGLTSSALTMNITVKPLPLNPGQISGNISPEAGSSDNIYSVDYTEGSSYEWTYTNDDATLLTDGPNATLTFSATAEPGTLSVIALNPCGESTVSNLAIRVQPMAVTGIESDLHDVSLYPNPSTGECMLQVPPMFIGKMIEVSDLLGRIVYSASVPDSESMINLSHLAKGNYILRITNGRSILSAKVVLK